MPSGALKPKIALVMGARPNFVKVAPLLRQHRQDPRLAADFSLVLVHTGQHSDDGMSGVFLRQLGIDEVHHHLHAGGGTHAEQTARVMVAFERICRAERPDWVVVVGDVDSTVACALAARKLGIRVCHVESGLRSFNREMPEEINRLATDAISDLLLTSCEDADRQLAAEGVDGRRVRRVGNLMIDTLRHHLDGVDPVPPERWGLPARERYCVVTLHRPSNVDAEPRLREVLVALARVAEKIPVLLACHPRTRASIDRHGLADLIDGRRFVATEPIDYLGMLSLYRSVAFVITDSGGVQEETTAIGLPCLTLRRDTERPVTVTEGTNVLIRDLGALAGAVDEVLAGRHKRGRIPDLWDGRAGARVWAALREACDVR